MEESDKEDKESEKEDEKEAEAGSDESDKAKETGWNGPFVAAPIGSLLPNPSRG